MTMDSTKAADLSRDSQSQYTNLDGRYGKIGISAVAAAVRYQGEPRRPTGYVPVDPQDYD